MPDIRRLWSSQHAAARIARAALLPSSAVFHLAATLRGWLYDVGAFRRYSLGAPTISVGNLTTGGTGKTPFAAWIAAQLIARGASPAILLRGYGDDEQRVHELLTPDASVVADRDRIRAARAVVARGADVVVLDDAFQHRRAGRDADIVLVSADAHDTSPWPLPAGPWREPMTAIRRASLAVVTRKAGSTDSVQRTVDRIAHDAPGVPIAVARIEADELRAWDGTGTMALREAAGRPLMVVSGIGDPDAFEAQLSAVGLAADVVRFADHHRYTESDVAGLASRARPGGLVICTLKDAVKLGPQWPHTAAPLWYVSQRISVERGADLLAQIIGGLLDARRTTASVAPPRTTY